MQGVRAKRLRETLRPLIIQEHKVGETPNYSEPAEDLSAAKFLEELIRHAR